ncbi:hypothetical protein, partial [Marivita sp.]|uniref:hypothetical protein n=1 Tax=Marivita sp. TaxID=2003365 RepID=UPI003F72E047
MISTDWGWRSVLSVWGVQCLPLPAVSTDPPDFPFWLFTQVQDYPERYLEGLEYGREVTKIIEVRQAAAF